MKHSTLLLLLIPSVRGSFTDHRLIEKGLMFAYSFDLIERPDTNRRLSHVSRLRSFFESSNTEFMSLISSIRNYNYTDSGVREIQSRSSSIFPELVSLETGQETLFSPPTDLTISETIPLADAVTLGVNVAKWSIVALWKSKILEENVTDSLPAIHMYSLSVSANHSAVCVYNTLRSALMYLQDNLRYSGNSSICGYLLSNN
jgi:hypothetical protein